MTEAEAEHLIERNALEHGLKESDCKIQNFVVPTMSDVTVEETIRLIEQCPTCPAYKPPFPWFGGKSRIAPVVWTALEDVANYVEPFFGSGAVLFRRPHTENGQIETVNDLDGMVANFWRAVQAEPELVAKYADWPVNECVPAGTMIATPNGQIPVEDVREGVVVWGERNGQLVETTVIATRVTESSAPFVRVGPLMLTGNHPVWTLENGYVEARALQSRLHVAMICKYDSLGSMCNMQKDVPPASAGWNVLFDGLQRDWQAVSREAMCNLRSDVSCTTRECHPTILLAELREALYVEAQSEEDAGKCSQCERDIAVERGSPSETCRMAVFAGKSDLRSRREAQVEHLAESSRLCIVESSWDKEAEATDSSSTDAACEIAGLGIGVDYQDLYFSWQNSRWQAESASALLVSVRYCRAGIENRHRSGRLFASRPESDRPTTGWHFDCVRMASLEVQQSPDSDQSRQGHSRNRSCTVYNFQTITGNYFANAILVHNCDLTARHIWLVARKDTLQLRLEGDPEFFDAKIAGWWVWGQSSWIGRGWCDGVGPWTTSDGELVDLRKLPHLGDAGLGVNRKLPHLGSAGQGVNRQLPHLGDAGQGKCEEYSSFLRAYINGLADRLRRVRVCCGDWQRILTPAVTMCHGITGVVLDPPYTAEAGRDERIYNKEDSAVGHVVRDWAVANGNNQLFRIALFGYDGEHKLPITWQKVQWKAQGGMGNLSANGRGRENAKRETIWFSPHCRKVGSDREDDEWKFPTG